MNESYVRNVVEAALLAAGKPLQLADLAQLFDENARPQTQDIHAALEALGGEYSGRGIEIKETAAGFRIQVRKELANEISRLWPERPARYSRALLETLALIAYRQPITRAEIEAVRGVAVNPNILKTVIERNWVRVVGHRDVPGRPELLGTTREFLDYFGLRSLDELPPLSELKALSDVQVQFDLQGPLPAEDASAAVQDGVAAVAVDGVAGTEDGHGESDSVAAGVAEAHESTRSATGETELVGDAMAEGSLDSPAADEADSASDEAMDAVGGDEDVGEDDELSAADTGKRELVAGPRDLDN